MIRETNNNNTNKLGPPGLPLFSKRDAVAVNRKTCYTFNDKIEIQFWHSYSTSM